MLGKPEKALAAADKHISRGDVPSALRILDELIAYDPFEPTTRRKRAGLLLERKEYDAAIEDLEIVLLLCKRDDHALASMAGAHLAMGRRASAVQAFSQALALNPLNMEALKGLMHIAESADS